MMRKRSTNRSRGGDACWLAPVLLMAALAVVIPPSGSRAAEAGSGPRVLVDFEDPDAVKQEAIQAEAVVVTADGGRAMEITTDPQASWPGVLLKPREGKWDLSGFDAVQIDVRNPQEVPVRVVLSVNNPGSDGQRHCNAESVNVAPRGKATLVAPFGMWHGDTGHPIDQSNIVSIW